MLKIFSILKKTEKKEKKKKEVSNKQMSLEEESREDYLIIFTLTYAFSQPIFGKI